MITFKCSGCGANFSVRDKYAGRKTKCPKCGKSLCVPVPSAGPSLDEEIDQIVLETLIGPEREEFSSKRIQAPVDQTRAAADQKLIAEGRAVFSAEREFLQAIATNNDDQFASKNVDREFLPRDVDRLVHLLRFETVTDKVIIDDLVLPAAIALRCFHNSAGEAVLLRMWQLGSFLRDYDTLRARALQDACGQAYDTLRARGVFHHTEIVIRLARDSVDLAPPERERAWEARDIIESTLRRHPARFKDDHLIEIIGYETLRLDYPFYPAVVGHEATGEEVIYSQASGGPVEKSASETIRLAKEERGRRGPRTWVL